VSLYRLWRLIGKYRPDLVEFGTPKAGLLGTLAAWLRGVPRRVYMCGAQARIHVGLKRRILLAAERMAARCAHVVLCNSESLRAEALALRLLHIATALVRRGQQQRRRYRALLSGPSTVREQLGIPHYVPSSALRAA